MKTEIRFLVVLAFLASTALSNATITTADLWSTDNSKLNCNWNWDQGSATLQMGANQYAGGSVTGYIDTTDISDPTLFRFNAIENDTALAWSDYHVIVSMLQSTFTLSAVNISTPGGWTYNITPTTFNGTEYVGEIDLSYNNGTPVQVGNTLAFNYNINGFSGATHYTITEDLTPSTVPEPATLSLAVLGGILLGCFSLSGRCRKS